MVYLVASLASMIMLAAGLSVIYMTVSASQARIIGALLGQPRERAMTVVHRERPRSRIRVSAVRPLQPMRVAA